VEESDDFNVINEEGITI